MRLPSTRNLLRTITGVSLLGLTGIIYTKRRVVEQVRNEEYYRQAMKILRAHPGAIEYLGEPIKEYGFDLNYPEQNHCDGQNAVYEISIRGSKDKGTYFIWAQRNGAWNVNRAELEINSIPDKRLIIKKE